MNTCPLADRRMVWDNRREHKSAPAMREHPGAWPATKELTLHILGPIPQAHHIHGGAA